MSTTSNHLVITSYAKAPAKEGKRVATRPSARKPFVSSILLWMRTDQPRQQGMDYWKGPHSKIISATPGFEVPPGPSGGEQSRAVAGH